MVRTLLRLVERFGAVRVALVLAGLSFVVVLLLGSVGLRLLLGGPELREGAIIALSALALTVFGSKLVAAMYLVDHLLAAKRHLEIEIAERDQAERRLQEMSFKDQLTGLANRRLLEEAGGRLAAQARRHGRPLALVMLDLDGFKAINDAHGHLRGDRVLRLIGERLSSGMRAGDVVARLGGDEFVVLMPDTDLVGAIQAAERLRLAIAGNARLEGVTISAGVAAATGSVADLDSLVAAADEALLDAKRRGRNRIVAAEALLPGRAPAASTPRPATG